MLGASTRWLPERTAVRRVFPGLVGETLQKVGKRIGKYGKVRCDASIRQQTRSLPLAVSGFVIDKVIPSYRIVPSCFLHQDITSSPRTICHPGSIWSIDLRNRSSSCSLERRKPSSTLSSIRTSCSSIRPSRPSCSSIRPSRKICSSTRTTFPSCPI